MTYNGTYEQADLQPIIVDGIGTGFAVVVSLLGLIVLVGILVFLVGSFMRLGKVIGFKR